MAVGCFGPEVRCYSSYGTHHQGGTAHQNHSFGWHLDSRASAYLCPPGACSALAPYLPPLIELHELEPHTATSQEPQIKNVQVQGLAPC